MNDRQVGHAEPEDAASCDARAFECLLPIVEIPSALQLQNLTAQRTVRSAPASLVDRVEGVRVLDAELGSCSLPDNLLDGNHESALFFAGLGRLRGLGHLQEMTHRREREVSCRRPRPRSTEVRMQSRMASSSRV